MPFNFDQAPKRTNTNSYKWDKFDKNVLPMWVADMDFQSPPQIIEALDKLVKHGVYGYSHAPLELTEVVMERLEKLHQWKVEKEWIVFLPGLVPAIHTSVRMLGNDYKNVLTSTPVYYPFMQAADFGSSRLNAIPFVQTKSRWSMDFDEIEKSITPDSQMYLLCNPHNPNGRVFDKIELEKLAEICLKKDMLIMSDEIHCDLILDEEKKHISIGSLNSEIAAKTITLLAPSKTFNIAGLGCSIAIIPDKKIRENFQRESFGVIPWPTSFAYEAALAAYKYGEPWRKELIPYLKTNHDLLYEEVNKIEGLEMLKLEATYLAWIKYDKKIEGNIEQYLGNHGLGISPGEQFEGTGYFRLNFGTQKSNVVSAIEILKEAFS